MSGSGRAGNGRGNNRRRPFKRRDDDSRQVENSPQGKRPSAQGSGSSARSDVPQRHEAAVRNESSPRNTGGRGGENPGRQHRGGVSRRGEDTREKKPFIERPKWTPPKLNTDPLPVHNCPWCGKPIRDASTALADRDTGVPVHFDCVAARIAGGERLEKGETISYIGGGRFGIISFGGGGGSPQRTDGHKFTGSSSHDFKIKKIIEWENKDIRAEWRSEICEHYSVT